MIRKSNGSGAVPCIWHVYLTLGILVIFGFFLAPHPWVKSVLPAFMMASATVATIAGIWINRPTRPLAWYLIAAGLLLFAVGEVIFYVYETILNVGPFPSIADVFYLGEPVLLIAGLLLLVRGRTQEKDTASLIDAAIITTGVGLLAWTFLIAPYVQDPTLSLLERSILAAYPLSDVFLLGMAMRLVFSPGARTTAYRLLISGLVFLMFADVAYAGTALAGIYSLGSPVNALYLLSETLLGLAALHPSMRKLSEPAPDCKLEITTRRLTMLAGASLMAPAVLAIQAVRGEQLDIPVIVGSSVVLSVLVLIRMEGLIRNLKKTLAEREALQIQLEYRALHDPLTGLPNRALFTDRLQVALSKTSRHGGAVAVLFLDLDSFKQVNDSLGHNAGDKLLREISGRLAACVRSHDTLARLGGDEFVLLLVDVDQRYTADVAQRMIETAKIPHIIDGHRAQVSASIGIFLGQGGNNPDGLLRAADAAMYHAKRSGREKYTFFSELPMAEAQSS